MHHHKPYRLYMITRNSESEWRGLVRNFAKIMSVYALCSEWFLQRDEWDVILDRESAVHQTLIRSRVHECTQRDGITRPRERHREEFVVGFGQICLAHQNALF